MAKVTFSHRFSNKTYEVDEGIAGLVVQFNRFVPTTESCSGKLTPSTIDLKKVPYYHDARKERYFLKGLKKSSLQEISIYPPYVICYATQEDLETLEAIARLPVLAAEHVLLCPNRLEEKEIEKNRPYIYHPMLFLATKKNWKREDHEMCWSVPYDGDPDSAVVIYREVHAKFRLARERFTEEVRKFLDRKSRRAESWATLA